MYRHTNNECTDKIIERPSKMITIESATGSKLYIVFILFVFSSTFCTENNFQIVHKKNNRVHLWLKEIINKNKAQY